ncbi:MAG: TonB family protein [Bacteroidales bacterium]
MNQFGLFLLKSVLCTSGFALVYMFILSNERFFKLKRVYLLAGLVLSFLLPFITITYYIDLPDHSGIQTDLATRAELIRTAGGVTTSAFPMIWAVYIFGSSVLAFIFLFQGSSVIRKLKQAEVTSERSIRVIRSEKITTPFSFFSWVFVNPSISDTESREIMNHELVHVRQKHWIDLILAGLLCIIQWFNPLSWLYFHFIRQNHEYLADEGALQQTSDPAVYKAVLLNQITGSRLFNLSNSFSYSLTKKRFNMMKNIVTSPYRKFRLLLVLPVLAAILYAFASPEYRIPGGNDQANAQQQKAVKGVVLKQSGAPLPGANVQVMGTTIGTSTDGKGYFVLTGIPEDAKLAVTYIGFTSKVVKVDFSTTMAITLKSDTLNLGSAITVPPPPPPPPPVMAGFDAEDPSKAPLVYIDDKLYKGKLADVNPDNIQSMNVLTPEQAGPKYGDKGKNGVLLITLKKEGTANKASETVKTATRNDEAKDEKPGMYVMVEEMPSYPGGDQALKAWISANIKYPAEAAKKKTTGKVLVTFEVTEVGTIKNVKAVQPADPALAAEAVRVISSMKGWKAGRQNGKPVGVAMKMTVDFSL